MSLLETETALLNGNGRTKTASTKLTAEELTEFEKYAKEHGKVPGELIRDLILREMKPESRSVDRTLIEVVGMELLLMNVLKFIATGQPMSGEDYDALVAKIHRQKKAEARKLS